MISLQKNPSTGMQDYQLGDQMPDTSYYMGVSEDTGTDFFLFLESVGASKTADAVQFSRGTSVLSKRYTNKQTFRGHKFSKFQVDGKGDEDKIKKSYAENMADGGLRRLTKKELAQVEKVFQAKPELRKLALAVCSNNNWVQSASLDIIGSAWFQHFHDGLQYDFSRHNVDASLLVGRSEPNPQP